MKKRLLRLSVGKKIWAGFVLLLLLTISNFLLTYKTLMESRKIDEEINTMYKPSLEALTSLHLLVVHSKVHMTNWVFIHTGTINMDRLMLTKLINKDYPAIKSKIVHLSKFWHPREKERVHLLFHDIDKLFAIHQSIMDVLKVRSDDPNRIHVLRSRVESGDVEHKTKYVLDELNEILIIQEAEAQDINIKMNHSMEKLQEIVVYSGFVLIIGGLLIAFFTTRTIVLPIKYLRNIIQKMSLGILPSHAIQKRDDEIGDMTLALDELVSGIQRTTNFSREIGNGNFNSVYKPLSEYDTLGFALLKMRDDLRVNEEFLENKVKERTEELEKKNLIIEENSAKIQHLYNDVTDSIKYALRIQNSILPRVDYVKTYLKDVFFFYKPKDIISGDFYYFEEQGEDFFIGAVDCTGHGVPGALMSMVGYSIINRAITDRALTSPAAILDELNESVSTSLKAGLDGQNSKDGMDIALCRINYKKNLLEYAGAFNPLYKISDGVLEEFKADKFPIGHFAEEPDRKYTNITFELKKDDIYYIFSDGFADQFGGPKGKKFMYKQFRETLLDIHLLPFEVQKEKLNEVITNWMGNEPQLDDILVIGFKPI